MEPVFCEECGAELSDCRCECDGCDDFDFDDVLPDDFDADWFDL